MTIRNIVPRNNNEGQLGTENKKWNKIYTNEIFATNFTGNLTGTADNAIKDNKSQQIDATYIKNISINNDTLTVTKGNDDSQDITINNISHAISSDNAINANKLQELTAGNSKGQIPINNGIENVNLNAALLNGKASSYFATSNHTHTTATQSSNGYMSNADKKKLDGIASGAEVNQNAFANVKVGSTTIQSDAKQDTLELAAGTNISLVGDANNDKVTIGVTGKVASASQADNATNATKATQDKNGLQIDTNYLKLSGGTMNGTLNTSKTTNTYLAGNQGQAIINSTASNGAYTMLAKMNSSNGKFTHGVYQGDYLLQYTNNTTISAGTNAVTKSVTLLDESGNTNFSGTVTAPSFNGTATKATQDSAGQTINTTYVKGVTANNATLTITKGNGSTSTTTVNNVSRAEYSDRVGTNAGYTGSTTGSSLKGGLSQASIYNNSFPFAYGNLISVKNSGANQIALEWSGTTGAVGRVAVRSARDAGIDTWSAWRYLAYTESPAFSGSPTAPTPGTSDNSTRVATTAFVQSLINSLKGLINAKNDVYIGAGTGSVRNTSFTIPLPSGYSRSQCKYAVFPTSIGLSTNNGYFSLSVDQSTGIVRGSVRSNITGGGYRYSDIGIGYLVVAVK